MADFPTLAGGCRCGRVRFEVSARPLFTMACHCKGCQRMTASAFSLSMAVPPEAFRLSAGTVEEGGAHGDAVKHHHCGWCKSWIYSELVPSMGFVNVRTAMLDEAAWAVPFVETQTADKLPWATTPSRHSFPGFPPPERYELILAEFKEAGIAPA